jgi:hypothetical protein
VSAVFANLIGDDRAAVFQVDGVSPCAVQSRPTDHGEQRYKENGDT